jgi:hypothetical protein
MADELQVDLRKRLSYIPPLSADVAAALAARVKAKVSTRITDPGPVYPPLTHTSLDAKERCCRCRTHIGCECWRHSLQQNGGVRLPVGVSAGGLHCDARAKRGMGEPARLDCCVASS